jgi:hypothetical protein
MLHQATARQSQPAKPQGPTVSARGAPKVVIVLNADELLGLEIPNGQPRFMLAIRLPDGRAVAADLSAKSVRRAIAATHENGPDNVTLILQGKLGADDRIVEAGIAAQVKATPPAAAPQTIATPGLETP